MSQQIAALEKSVGGAVFDRPGGPRPVRITPLGEGVGSAVLPRLALHGSDAWSDDRLGIHRLRPSPTLAWSLYWPAGRTPSPLATRAIDIAVETATELAAQM